MTDMQRRYIAHATLMARSLSSEQLEIRARLLGDQLRSIARLDEVAEPTEFSGSLTRIARTAKRKKARKAKRACLTVPFSALPSSSAFIDLPSPPALTAVSSISMEPTGHIDHDVLTSTPILATVDSSILAITDVHPVVLDRVGNFNPYTDRVHPFLKGVITRASVIKATHILRQHNCPFRPVMLCAWIW